MIQNTSIRIDSVQHQYDLIQVQSNVIINMSWCILVFTVTKLLWWLHYKSVICEQSTVCESMSHLWSPRYGRSGRDWLGHEVIVIARGTSCHIRVWATSPGVCTPSRHHCLLRLPWQHKHSHQLHSCCWNWVKVAMCVHVWVCKWYSWLLYYSEPVTLRGYILSLC